ncbi:hypothetical protein QLX67_00780 [Balneolaceae bacterium ANBcel3]|nr:hypothetical protein [Balneolaceae bacterium ANBcel3]
MKKKRHPHRKKNDPSSKKVQKDTPSLIPDIWNTLSPKHQHLILLAFLFLIPAFIFPEVYSFSQRFVAHDIQQFTATAQSVIEYREETGDDALWATNIFSGMPSFTVIKNHAFQHIDSFLRALFPAFFIPAIPLMIAAGGIYFLLWLMGFKPLPSALAALAITLSTYIPIIVGAGHNSKLIAWSFIPWVIAGYWMTSRSPYRLAGLFVFAMALNFALRAEHIQVVYYFLVMLAVWFLFDTIEALREKKQAEWVKRFGLMVAAGLIALAANTQPYWSTYEYSSYSIRGGSELRAETGNGSGGLDTDYAFAWSQGRAELLTLIIPESFGGSSMDGGYWGPKTFTSGPHYLGALVFLLFIIGLIRAPGRLKYVFLSAGTLTLLFSLGKNFYSFNILFFNYFPLFNKFRTPEMWLIVTVFCFVLIAAMGMKWLYDQWSDHSLTLKSLYLPLGITLGTALFFALFIGHVLTFEKDGERAMMSEQLARQHDLDPRSEQVQQAIGQYMSTEIIPERQRKASSDSLRFLLLIAAGSGLIVLAATRRLSMNYALTGMLILTAVDLVQVGKRYTDKSGLVSADMSYQNVLEQKVRPMDRFIEQHIFEDRIWPWRSLPLGDSPFNNAVPASFVYPSVGGYSGAKLSHYQDVIDHAFYSGRHGINLNVLNMLNTRYISYPSPLGLPGFRVVYQEQDGVVMENQNALPKTFFVDSLTVKNSIRETVEALNDFDPASTAILMPDSTTPEIVPTENRSSRVTEYGPRQINIEIETDQPSFLVLSEIYYPKGWYAFLNEEETDIIRTNYLLRGVYVPEGNHELVFRFDPRSHLLGSTISRTFNLILLLIGGFVLLGFYQNRHQTAQSDKDSEANSDKSVPPQNE